jgi:hypothetical protein
MNHIWPFIMIPLAFLIGGTLAVLLHDGTTKYDPLFDAMEQRLKECQDILNKINN